jgi:hypothetical protein
MTRWPNVMAIFSLQGNSKKIPATGAGKKLRLIGDSSLILQ